VNVAINYKRVFLTTTLCFIFGIVSAYLTNLKSLDFFTSIYTFPVLFSIAIPLTNIDRITTREKYQGFLISIALTFILFYISVHFTITSHFQNLWFLKRYIVSPLAGIVIILITNLYIKIKDLKFGVILCGVLASCVPIIINIYWHRDLSHPYKLHLFEGLSIEFISPTDYFIIWQTLLGFGISLGIWMRLTNSTSDNTQLPPGPADAID
jgi:hypothetical protein